MTNSRKRILAAVVAAVILAAAAALYALRPPAVQAADFTLPALSGETVRLSDYEGESPVVVTFWASWCPDCREELPAVYQVASEYDEADVTFLMVNSTSGVKESREAAVAYLDRTGMDFQTVLFDEKGEAAEAYGLFFIPCTLLIDRNGTIIKRYDDIITEAELRREVESLLLLDRYFT